MNKIIFFLFLLLQIGFSQEFYVDIKVKNVVDMMGMNLHINYNPEIIDWIYDEPMNLGFYSNPTIISQLQKDAITGNDIPGHLIVGYTQIPITATSGDNSCLRIKFNRKEAGQHDLYFLEKSSIQGLNGEINSLWFTDDSSNTNSPQVIMITNSINSIDDKNNNIPTEYNLSQNYPNPFNSTTSIEFSIKENNYVELSIINILGQQIDKLVDNNLNIGTYRVLYSKNIASGNYFYKLNVGHGKYIDIKRMVKLN